MGLPAGVVEYALFVPRAAFPKGRAVDAGATALAGFIGSTRGEQRGECGASRVGGGERRPVECPVACTSLVQAAAAVKGLGMAAVLPVWAKSEFNPDTVTRMTLAPLREIETPLVLVWSRRQAGIRPILSGLARTLASALTA